MKHLAFLALLGACAAEAPETTTETTDLAQASTGALLHEHFDTPFGRVHHVHVAGRHTARAAMLVHGDFSTFDSNFTGLAPYLASQGEDVWGVDRRWATIPADGDLTPLATMGVAAEIRDLGAAIAFARLLRLAAGEHDAPLALVGFSHGAQLSYIYAARYRNANIGAVVALDFYAGLRADQQDARAAICGGAETEYGYVADGEPDQANDFFIQLGQLASAAPDDPSPLWDGLTNRQAFLTTAGQTYFFVPFAPLYHLLAPTLGADPDAPPTGLRSTPDARAETWFASAPPHESMLEAADLDQMLCTDNVQPIAAPLSNIKVPIYYVGAGGGVGELGIEALSHTSSRDITTSVISLGPDAATDYGHGDLLFASDARARVWTPLATWLGHH